MSASPMLENDPLWYQKAVIYQVNVRSFFDANGDGIGDFKGITAKLDYLQKLGINTLWLMPFYPSPLRDDGYDISDYLSVNPLYGNLDDVKELIAEAHARGLRVVTELIINHTSDQHPWFQAARNAPKGSAERDFYVWSDDPSKYSEARIIFKDFEASNWSWDEVAGQYFWHRFFHHQPDLNFDNPAVHKAVFDTLDFWLDLGVDGFRLDAIPYLYEREGTTGENLPETHAFLKQLRSHMDSKYSNRMLLAEANQWPEDTRPYFGDGDECHMNYNFPIMPRMYMSLMQEDSFPLMDILSQTPEIPAGCQWAMFLRNHDELTLEMVTEEERQYMWRTYSPDARGRINLGIRRRIFPLMQGDVTRVRLLNCLLLSFPGTPVLYYGDEIGMGDNLELDDRFGVRTPMQWSASKNAGFSAADESKLLLPVITDSAYSPEKVNVEAQEADEFSQLAWTRKILAVRNQHPVFGNGEIKFLASENSKVVSYLRSNADETILVIANLSSSLQRVDLELEGFEGNQMVDMFTGEKFGLVDTSSQRFTLQPHEFYWLQVSAAAATRPVIKVSEWTEIFEKPIAKVTFEKTLADLISGPDYANANVRSAQLLDVVEVNAQPYLRWLLVDVEIAGQERTTYVMLIGFSDLNEHAFMQVNAGLIEGGLFDLTLTEEIAGEIFEYAKVATTLAGAHGDIQVIGEVTVSEPVIRLFAKTGVEPNPAWEIGNYLHRVGFAGAFGTTSAINYVSRADGSSRTIATIESGDANSTSLAELVQIDATMPISNTLEQVGKALAQLHEVLTAATEVGLKPIPFTSHYQRSVYQTVRSQLHRASLAVTKAVANPDVKKLLADLTDTLSNIKDDRIDGTRIRTHGNLDSNRVYLGASGVQFIDFSGGSSRHLAERRIPVSAMTDLAHLSVDLRFRYRLETALSAVEIKNRISSLQAAYFANSEEFLSEGEANARVLLRGYELLYLAQRIEDAASVQDLETLEIGLSQISFFI
jgi:maltose alpha-D-glucosyltransferase / alpha-amylase